MPKYIRRFRSISSAVDAELYSPTLVDVAQDDESKLLMKDVEADDTILCIENDDIEHIEIQPAYLTMKATIASSVSLSNYGGNQPNIEFSINNDNENWYDWKTYNNYTAIALNAGDNIRFRGENLNGFSQTLSIYSCFVVTGSINLSGNIMSLIDKLGTTRSIPECPCCFCRLFKDQAAIKSCCILPATNLYGACYFSLFQGTGITSINKLKLPAKILSYSEHGTSGAHTTTDIGCYQQMFYGCANLTSVPELPAVSLSDYCYSYMFYGCTRLTYAPELPSTILANNCYRIMFSGCTNLIKAPSVLPALECKESCYLWMFYGCTSLTTAPELPATTLANNCYYSMFHGCTNLRKGPSILPALTIPDGYKNENQIHSPYAYMFNGCTNLTSAPELPATTLGTYCYTNMFRDCINLISVPSILPALECKDTCYGWMFYGCTNLTVAPKLLATTLAKDCYYCMFYGCTNLKKGPSILPALTIPDGYKVENNIYGTYAGMFYNCTSLTSTPELPAINLGTYCYYQMFYNCINLTSAPTLSTSQLDKLYAYGKMFCNCSNLSYVKCLLENPDEMENDVQWLYNVAASGTFVKKRGIIWSRRSEHGIPSGWTVEEADS